MTGSADVDAYIQALEGPAREAVAQLVETVRAAAPGRPEKLRYGMPAIELAPGRWLHFGAWRRHIGVYPVPPLPDGLEQRIQPYRTTTSTVNLPLASPMPLELVADAVRALTGSTGSPTTERDDR